LTGKGRDYRPVPYTRLRDVKPPAAVDWREHGVVAPVKDQEGVI
jgi:hypothetical protein